ncbi:hypothetical protein DACRYDRAFT_113732 [Dacryopinax primogenitus]|uniref:BTB domain-containing protein n=1 Tax=Dacryopinax primogenitus (strain DJM 731) TaxID=1858805 RepID=M5GA31_DACPD|nr:uncharacterized protein DACRYDRAFT_113732 [Dacryopinax primogenitus]EJU05674.1 hypothetical protein DACRYDRAFT_113732 [Dacryopinax primogenitus]
MPMTPCAPSTYAGTIRSRAPSIYEEVPEADQWHNRPPSRVRPPSPTGSVHIGCGSQHSEPADEPPIEMGTHRGRPASVRSVPPEYPMFAPEHVETPEASTHEVEHQQTFHVPDVFLDPLADLVLESSDNVSFRVHGAILRWGSTYFKQYLTEHPTTSPIPWHETAATILAVLYRLYPVVNPAIDNIEDLIHLALAAHKCGMDSVVAEVRGLLLEPRFLHSRPLAVYRVACQLSLDDIKRSAARYLVEQYDPFDLALRLDMTPELSAPDFLALYELRKKRVDHALEALKRHLGNPRISHKCEVTHEYETIRARLRDTPSASVLASIPDSFPGQVPPDHGCDRRDCQANWSRLKALKAELADPDSLIVIDVFVNRSLKLI